MPIQLVGSKVATTVNVFDAEISLTDLTGGISSAPQEGDFVVAMVGLAEDANIYVAGFSDFADMAYTVPDTYTSSARGQYKRMTATPDTSITLVGTGNTGTGGAVAIMVLRGVHPTNPVDVSVPFNNIADSARPNPPSITPTVAGAWIISMGFASHAAGLQTFSSSDLDGFISAGVNSTRDATIGIGYKEWTGGPFDPAQFTFSGSNSTQYSNIGGTLALRPAPATRSQTIIIH